ncbi:hypothetical protein AURDEDRAFT_174374 [Auricularia subglabra TFB-10046 SS5]|nr:hypothetical protein AURDEDRAFT_174374 [Auricularia subglabra TFB-10046 SS5]
MPRMRFVLNPASRRRHPARFHPVVQPAYGRFEAVRTAADWLPFRTRPPKPKIAPRGATAKLQCLRQVEYYLSESFLPYDQPLWERYWASQADHWIPLAVLAGYAELRPYRDAHDTPWIADALLRSTRLELDRAGLRVRRRNALDSNAVLTDDFDRTLYVAGFPTSPAPRPGSLKAFFCKFGPVVVRRRRDIYTGQFDGSVFAEFAERHDLEKFLASNPAWHGYKLDATTKEAFCALKINEWGFSSSAMSRLLRSRYTPRAYIPPRRKRQEDDDLNESLTGQPSVVPMEFLTPHELTGP